MVIPSCKARAADLHWNSIGPFKLTMPGAVACQHVYILHAHYPQLTDAVYPYQILPVGMSHVHTQACPSSPAMCLVCPMSALLANILTMAVGPWRG